MGSFVPRLLALTVIWLFATAALTFAAAQRMGATPAVTATTTTTAAAPVVLVVPDLRQQAFVFAKGSLTDAGFSFRIAGPVHGFASNTVVSQSPAPGTRVVARVAGADVAGELVAHPVYDPERRRAKELSAATA